MYVRMSWKEAERHWSAHEDFVITGGNGSSPYGWRRFYARDYHVGEDRFLTALEVLSTYCDESVNCWKQVPDGVEEPQEGKIFCMKVYDKVRQKFATAWMRASGEDTAKLEADYRGYKVVQIEEREA